MRKTFFDCLHAEMKQNEDIHFLTADLGWGLADKIKQDFPERFWNVQAAEQLMIGAAVGLTLQGKIAVCYSISPFLLHRPYEWIKLYLEHEGIPVKLVGSGWGEDYDRDGISHHIFEFPFKFEHYKPSDKAMMPRMLRDILSNNKPIFLSLKR